MPFTISEIKTKEHSPSVVLIVVIKLIVDVNWSFHMSVHLHLKETENAEENVKNNDLTLRSKKGPLFLQISNMYMIKFTCRESCRETSTDAFAF